jgi:hypothetical protein
MSDQGKEYADFIAAQLKSENDRRDNINSRATAAVVGASGVVTVVLAVFAVLIHKDFTLEGCAKDYLEVALGALLVGAILAVVAGIPMHYKLPASKFMEQMLNKPHWKDSPVAARNITAYSNLVVIDSLRPANRAKTWILVGAYACQVLGIVALGGCTLAVLGICVWPMSQVGWSSTTTTTTTPPPPSPSPTTVVVTVTCPCAHHGAGVPKHDP